MDITVTSIATSGVVQSLIATCISVLVIKSMRNSFLSKLIVALVVVVFLLGLVALVTDHVYLIYFCLPIIGFFLACLFVLVQFGLHRCENATLSNMKHIKVIIKAVAESHAVGAGGNEEGVSVVSMCGIVDGNRDISTFMDMLCRAHRAAQPLIALIARVSTQGILAQPNGEKGEHMSNRTYLNLLKKSLDYPELQDVTFISRVLPSAWFDGKMAAGIDDYFQSQAHRHKNGVKIRRYVMAERDLYDADLRLADFKKKHNDNGIDLFFHSVDEVPNLTRDEIKDMAVFFGKDGLGWALQSTLSEDQDKLGVVTVVLLHETAHIQICKDMLLTYLLEGYSLSKITSAPWSERIETDGLANAPDRDFLIRHGFNVGR